MSFCCTTVSVNGTTVAGETRYRPFGAERYSSGQTLTSYQYTGQRAEAGLGLYYYGARWYDPALGRFIQPDTIVPNPGDAQSFDRYAYGLNNPLRYSDPTGHYSRDEIIQHFGCEANDWSCVDRQFHQNNVDSPYRGKGDWLQILIDAVDGDPISARNSQYAAVMQGKFLRNPETGKIEIQMMLPDGQLTGPLPELTFVNYGAGHQRYSLESAKYNTHVGQLYHLTPIECQIWDCVALGYDLAGLGGSVLVNVSLAGELPSGGLTTAGVTTGMIVNQAATAGGLAHTIQGYKTGDSSAADMVVVSVTSTLNPFPVVGTFAGVAQLFWDLADPFHPW